MNKLKAYIQSDIVSGLVVFLVSVPLCLGIALASGAPLFAGMIAGIVGGIVVGSLSGSPLSVSGPAAGLTAIVLSGISKLGAFDIFLLSVMIGGVLQLILGMIKAGSIGYFVPSAVITGMLTAIGFIIVINQLPYLLGLDFTHLKNGMSGSNLSAQGILTTLSESLHFGSLSIGIIALVVMILWDKYKPVRVKIVPGAAIAVLAGILINYLFILSGNEALQLGKSNLVNLPVANDFGEILGLFTFPDFSQIFNKEVWILGMTIGIVASLESLLNVEAVDKIDPLKRFTDSNRELLAQGTGNLVSGLIGGLPVTSVIVRSSANMNAGAKSKFSAIFNGFLLVAGAILIPVLLNYIPLASLAAILVITGFKLCKPAIFTTKFKQSKYQWVPFIVTFIAIVSTDLLIGVGIGIFSAAGAVLIGNLKNSYYLHREEIKGHRLFRIELAQEVSFLNKAALAITLDRLPEDSTVLIDATHTAYIDFDVLETIREFEAYKAPAKNIKTMLTGFKDVYNIQNTEQIFIEDMVSVEVKPQRKKGMIAKEALQSLKLEFTK